MINRGADIMCNACCTVLSVIICHRCFEACTATKEGRACLCAIAAIVLVGSLFLGMGALASHTSFGHNMLAGMEMSAADAAWVSIVGIFVGGGLFIIACRPRPARAL